MNPIPHGAPKAGVKRDGWVRKVEREYLLRHAATSVDN